MKTTLIIDQKKIKKVKEKIQIESYREQAIGQLAHELSFVFS